MTKKTSDKIRILYTIPNFDTAGSGKVLCDLANGLNKNEFDVEIACSHNRGAFFKEVEKLGFPIHIVRTTTDYRPYASLFSRLHPIKKHIKENRYDVVHSWHWSSDWTEALASKWAGAKWVYTKKAMSWGSKHWKIRSFLADFIVTLNDEMKVYFPNKKSQGLIPIGIDTNYYDPENTGKSKLSADYFNIITVANLVAIKGIEVLIDALRLLDDERVRLTIVGDDATSYGECLKAHCKANGLENRVVFTGKKVDVRPYIKHADVYVIPTLDRGEGMPMALVEAMSMAVPVLGSDVSGINFVLKDFKSQLFEAGNAHELAARIKTIMQLSKKERQSLGGNLREYVVAHFTMEKFIQRHENLYRKLLKR